MLPLHQPEAYVAYEEEDTCHMRRRIHVTAAAVVLPLHQPEAYVAYEEEDTCHMRRSIHVTAAAVVLPLHQQLPLGTR